MRRRTPHAFHVTPNPSSYPHVFRSVSHAIGWFVVITTKPVEPSKAQDFIAESFLAIVLEERDNFWKAQKRPVELHLFHRTSVRANKHGACTLDFYCASIPVYLNHAVGSSL